MVSKKRKPSRNASRDADQESVADVNQVPASRDIRFSGFLDGLLATSSPPSALINKQDEMKQTAIRVVEEQRRVVEEAINLRFDGIIAALENSEIGRTAVWQEGDVIDVAQSLLEATKADEIHSGSHGFCASRTGSTARLGNPTPRRSAGYSNPGLKNGFHFNIATVLPHPPQDESVPPASILRKPKLGETAISMAGSPLLVNSDNVSVPSLMLPLADGRVFSVQAGGTSYREQLRVGLDDQTINQLKGIKDFINNLVP